MRALDTNVLARFFVDDPDDEESAAQRPAAVMALSEPAFVSLTVLMEFEWVMRGFYKLRRAETVRVLRALAGITHVTLEHRTTVLDALDAHERGMDFADALHWHRSGQATTFATFDRGFATRAARDGDEELPAVELLAATGTG